ncbi:MAG: choice-of-anchor I family protein [Planctomycetota bacterium]
MFGSLGITRKPQSDTSKKRTAKRGSRRHVSAAGRSRTNRSNSSQHRRLIQETLESRQLMMADFTLQLLHASDLEGGVDAVDRAANFATIVESLETQAASGAEIDGSLLVSAGDNYIPGPFFNASGDRATFRDSGIFNDTYNELFGTTEYDSLREGSGRVDISIMNIIGFDASAIGNHEFDQGSDAFESIIEEDFRSPDGPASDRWVGAQFPYLSANLDFSGDSDLNNLFTADVLPNTAFATGPTESNAGNSSVPKIAPATVVDVDGELVGIVGATTPLVESISSPSASVMGPTTNDMVALAAVLQPVIDDVMDGEDNIAGNDDDVDKVVLVSHLQQIALEEALIGLLDGVDLVVAGGSDTLLADATDTLRAGDVADGQYPLLTTNGEGDPAAIVSTDGEYSYVGRLVVGFDANGVLDTTTIQSSVSGVFATNEVGVLSVTGAADLASAIAASPKGTAVKTLTDAVAGVVEAKDGNVLGRTGVFIEGRRSAVRTEETNMGNLTADANLFIAQQVDPTVAVSIKNGGGIRAEIGSIDGITGRRGPTTANTASGKRGGEISQLDIENSLRFNNGLSLLSLTADELRQVLEHGVAASGPGNTPGQFPQVSGVSFSFDPARPAIAFDGSGAVTTPGERIRNLAITDALGNVIDVLVRDGEIVGNPNRQIRIVTLGFLAGGGDNYPFDFLGDSRIDLDDSLLPGGQSDFAPAGSEQDALAEFLLARHATVPFYTNETPPEQDQRIQNLSVRNDSVLSEIASGELEVNRLSTIGESDGIVGAEISAFHPGSDRLFVTSASGIQVIDFSNPSAPTVVDVLEPSQFGASSDDVTSVAVGTGPSAGLFAIAVPNNNVTEPGDVLFFDAATSQFLGSVQVGALPDMITFTPDGQQLLVANEGQSAGEENEPNVLPNPVGSVSIVSVDVGNPNNSTAITADFSAFDTAVGADQASLPANGNVPAASGFDLAGEGVRIFPGLAASVDLEPEYITVAPDGLTAYVTLQENNAVAVLDLATGQFTDILPLGLKDHTLPQNALDPSNRDGGFQLRNLPVVGMYMPDAIASYASNGQNYFVTANEGDGRDIDEERADDDLPLDPATFPFAADLQTEDVLGRLKASNVNGDTDGDGDFDEIHAFGGRSFSIWNSEGQQVFDSGNFFERFTALTGSHPDNRSDDKGPEPEGVTVNQIGDSVYAFVGLERSHDVLIFNVTDPHRVQFVNNISVPGDQEPEGLTFIPASDSPTGYDLLVITNEDSNTLTTIALAPELTLSVEQNVVFEGGNVSATVRRQGDTSEDLIVTLSTSDDSEITLPETVTIPAGSAFAQFTITGADDSDVDGDITSTVTASSPSFVSSSSELTTVDDDAATPVVESVTINDGSAQRSLISSISVQFSTAVDLESGAFQLRNRNTLQVLDASQLIVTPEGGDRFTITFATGTSVRDRVGASSVLVDASYELTVNAAAVSATSGATPMATDFVFGDESEEDFFALFGDADGNGSVNIFDFVAARSAFLGGPYNAAFDFDGDGNTGLMTGGFDDVLQFLSNFRARRIF